MKYIFLAALSLPAFASRFADHIRSFEQDSKEVTLTFSNHNKVHRIPAGNSEIPCLENAWKAQKPVDVVFNDKSGNLLECKLAPKMHPGAVGY